MKEILFRGFCPNGRGKQIIILDGVIIRGDWKEGFYANWEFDANDDGGYYSKPPYFVTEHFIITNFDGGHVCSEDLHKVIHESVCQHTGLVDKENRRVFEGDIVNMHYFFENGDSATLGRFEDEAEVVGEVKIDEVGTYTETESDVFYWLQYLEAPSFEHGSEELEVIGDKFGTRRVE